MKSSRTKYYNFLIVVLIGLSASVNCIAQKAETINLSIKEQLIKHVWITDRILGLDEGLKEYKLTKLDQEFGYAGNLTDFNKDKSFTSQYVAPCGNDYFTDVVGKYSFTNDSTISITVNSVSYHGEWDKPTEYRKAKEIFFIISNSEKGIVFTKIEE